MIVVMNVCGMIEINSWEWNADGILMAWFPGQECGDAVADIIPGKVCPSGRLPMTFLIRYSDIPSSKNYPYLGQTEGKNFDFTDYEKDIWVGYRYFSTAKRGVSFPFGFGLSYTNFSYSKPKVTKSGEKYTVTATIKNLGNVSGSEVVQLYVKAPVDVSITDKPESELKAFTKTKLLAPGESETVKLTFSERDIASFDEAASAWSTASGTYIVQLRKSADPKSSVRSSSFKIGKKKLWPVKNILSPAKPVNVMKCDSVQEYPKDKTRDLALIYQGGAQRIDWTEEELLPYVTHQFADGHREWLFDGFLFLDFDDGMKHTFIPRYGMLNARKQEWSWYLDRLFEQGKSLDALDKCIGSMIDSIGEPGFKHKVVLSIPTPIAGQTDWGELGGRNLIFDNYGDRSAAAIWFIDQLVGRFYTAEYKNIELSGLYWIDEDICHTQDLVKFIAPAVHAKGLEFIWIPYYKARGYDRWKELGFDFAYYQPNHFFDKSIPDSRLDVACEEALSLGMAMEFECDSKALFNSDNSFYSRMRAYIDAFRRHNVFSTSSIAYYTGSKALIDMDKNPCAENQAIIDELAKLIVDRRKKASFNDK